MIQNVKYIGMPWYHREDYEKLRSIFTDSHVLPDTFDEWLHLAENNFKQISRQGVIVEKVYLDPDTFPAWCRVMGLDIDGKARVEFADTFVARKYLGQDV